MSRMAVMGRHPFLVLTMQPCRGPHELSSFIRTAWLSQEYASIAQAPHMISAMAMSENQIGTVDIM